MFKTFHTSLHKRIPLLVLDHFYYFAGLALLENPIKYCKLILHVVSIFTKI